MRCGPQVRAGTTAVYLPWKQSSKWEASSRQRGLPGEGNPSSKGGRWEREVIAEAELGRNVDPRGISPESLLKILPTCTA